MSLPTASTPGYGTFHGKVGCECVIEFLTVAERLGLLIGLIRESLDVVQLTGDADASSGVHSLGAAFDLKQFTDPWVRLLRKMGASYWPRTGSAWEGNEHGHGSIPCAHDDRVAYQFTAYRRGYNGLGRGYYNGALLWGYGAPDPCWRPDPIPTLAQGLAWARNQIEILEDPLSELTPTEQRNLYNRVMGGIPGGSTAGRKDADGTPTRVLDSADGDYLRRKIETTTAATAKLNTDLTAKIGSLAAVVAALEDDADLTFADALRAAEQGATAALDARIATATTVLEVAPTTQETPS